MNMYIIVAIVSISFVATTTPLFVIYLVVSGKLVNLVQKNFPSLWQKVGTFASFRFYRHVLLEGPIVDDPKYLELKKRTKFWLILSHVVALAGIPVVTIINGALLRLAR